MGVVIKPAGVECYSSANGGHGKNTVKSALPFALKPPAVGIKGAYRLPRAMHRLDRLTSGLFVVAKTRPAAVELARCFAEREIEKEYTAIVMEPKPHPVVVGGSQGTGGKPPLSPAVGVEGTVDEACHGQHAVTRYRIVKSLSSPSFHSPKGGLGELRFHLLTLKPETGRKHQLRLHCSHSLGMPIVGDELYDDQSEIAKALRVNGLFLHASSLQMKHPVYSSSRLEGIGVQEPSFGGGGEVTLDKGVPKGGEEEPGARLWLRIRIPLPASFQDLLAQAGRASCPGSGSEEELPALLSTLFGKQIIRRDKAIDRAVAKAAAGGNEQHPFKYPQRLTPEGVTICSFYNYGECRMGETCHWDHAHCHSCLGAGHRAADCAGR